VLRKPSLSENSLSDRGIGEEGNVFATPKKKWIITARLEEPETDAVLLYEADGRQLAGL
jgi:hypothetical protein